MTVGYWLAAAYRTYLETEKARATEAQAAQGYLSDLRQVVLEAHSPKKHRIK
ncbi:MAG: hypothetical protein KKC09_03435 [Gammaproteobacteria bacterium]|nr:hypothetical protein [Gammaproteobacteria bacterium]